jgi:Major Facilitator Superfamily
MHAVVDPGPSTTTRPHHNLRPVLGRRDFRRLLAVRLYSQVGDGVFQAGLAGSVFFNPQRAAGPMAIATAFAVLLVPYSTLGPFVGVFLDRWSRRQVLFVANAARAVLVLPAAWLVWRGDEGLLFVLAALAIVALNRFFLAGVSASLPHVADQDRLVTANSFASTAGAVVYAASLGGAGALFHMTGTKYHSYAVVASFAALGYGVSALLTLASFRPDALGPDDATRPAHTVGAALADSVRGLAAGVRHLVQRPVAARVVVVQAVHRGLYGVLALMTLLLYRNYFYVGSPKASVAGLLPIAAAAAVGALLAALVTPGATRRLGSQRWVVVLLGALAVGVPGLCLPMREAMLITGAVLISLVAQGVKIVSDTALQVECADDFRGRVFSVNDTAYNLLFVAGVFVGARVLPVTGRAPRIIVLIGLAYAATAFWYGMVSLRTRPAVA